MANKLLNKLNRPVGKAAKVKLDEWLNDNINMPIAQQGYENVGAGITAVLSAAGEMIIPDDLADVALSLIPGARLVKSAQKGMKVLKKVDKASPNLDYKLINKVNPPKNLKSKGKSSELDYSEIEKAEKAKAKSAREISEKNADTLMYTKDGKIVKKKSTKKSDPYDEELREIEFDDLP